MQHGQIDRSLHIKAEAAFGQQRPDHLVTAGVSPQVTKHEIRPDTGSPQLSELPAVVARQHDRASRMACCRGGQRIEHPGALDLITTAQGFNRPLHVPSAFTDVLDEIDVLVASNLLDADEHLAAPCWISREAPLNW